MTEDRRLFGSVRSASGTWESLRAALVLILYSVRIGPFAAGETSVLVRGRGDMPLVQFVVCVFEIKVTKSTLFSHCAYNMPSYAQRCWGSLVAVWHLW